MRTCFARGIFFVALLLMSCNKGIDLFSGSMITFTAPDFIIEKSQDAYNLVTENVRRAAGEMHSYEIPSRILDTPAPDGFAPFYISHIGRHGSRYQSDSSVYDLAIESLSEYESQLTAEGEWLLRLIQDIKDESEGHWGELTQVGRVELNGIADRMIDRFPCVFSNSNRNEIVTISTASKRVLESRDNFIGSISAKCSKLCIKSYYGSEVYDGFSASERVAGRDLTEQEQEKVDYLRDIPVEIAANPHTVTMDRLVAKTFSPVPSISNTKARRIFSRAFTAANTRQCLDSGLPYVDSYFSGDEAYTFWYLSNPPLYRGFGICIENEGIYSRAKGTPILRHIIEDADAAISDGKTAAHFRFSHDTCCQPLFSLVGAEGNEYQGTLFDINVHYMGFRSICMACNMQLVFYHNQDSDVVVKILHNEEEVGIPGLQSIDGIYYRWDILKNYLMSRI